MNLLCNRFRVPLNRAALMCQLQHLIGVGYYYWHAGSVPAEKACRLLDKFVCLYPILATPSQRATSKKKGIANVELLWGVDDSKPGYLRWFLLATKGKDRPGQTRYADSIHQLEPMKDARQVPLLLGTHYQLHQRLIEDRSEADRLRRKRGARLRWTWSMTRGTFGGWQDQVTQAAQSGDRYYQATFSHLIASPMFAGIRTDLAALESVGRATWKKNHTKAQFRPGLPHPLPFMPRIPVYGEMTLADLAEAALKKVDTVKAEARAQALAAVH